MIDAILWDWNGTLLDDVEANLSIVNGLLSDRSLPLLDLESYRAAFTMPVISFYHAVGMRVSQEEFDRIAEEYSRRYRQAFPSIPLAAGIAKVLAELQEGGVRSFVLSATRQDLLEEQVAAKGLAARFIGLKGGSDIRGSGKEGSARALVAEEGLDPASTLVVGDMIHDRDVARAIGARALLHSGGHQALPTSLVCPGPLAEAVRALAIVPRG